MRDPKPRGKSHLTGGRLSVQEAQRQALVWLPQSDRQLARRLHRQAGAVREASSTQERLRESTRLQRLLLGVEKRYERRAEAADPLKGRELARLAVMQNMLFRTQKALMVQGVQWKKAKTAREKKAIRIRFNAFKQHRQLLLNRIRELREALGLEERPALALGAVVRRKPLKATIIILPPVEFTLPLLRKMAAKLGRKSGETDPKFRSRLRAYTQRALLRALPRLGKEPADMLIDDVVETTLMEDVAAIEAEAQAGSIAIDPDAEMMDILLAPINDEFDAIVEDMQPPLPAPIESEKEIERLIKDANEYVKVLAKAPEEPQDIAEKEVGESNLSDALYPIGEEPNNGSRVPLDAADQALKDIEQLAAQLQADASSGLDQGLVLLDEGITAITPHMQEAQAQTAAALDEARKKGKLRKVAPFALVALGLLLYASRD